MRVRTRDAIVLGVFALGALLAALAWQPLGPWGSLAIAFLSALAAVVVYRVRPRTPPHRLEERLPLALHRTDAQ